MRRLSLALATLGVMAIQAKDAWGEVPDLRIPSEVAYCGSRYNWATSPGSYAPRYNQRKARKMARRVNRKVA